MIYKNLSNLKFSPTMTWYICDLKSRAKITWSQRDNNGSSDLEELEVTTPNFPAEMSTIGRRRHVLSLSMGFTA